MFSMHKERERERERIQLRETKKGCVRITRRGNIAMGILNRGARITFEQRKKPAFLRSSIRVKIIISIEASDLI